MRFLLVTIFILAINQTSVWGQDDYCFGKDEERIQTKHFSSLTAYEIAKGNGIDRQYLVPNCSPTKIWILHRHGTRLPTKKVIQNAPRLTQLQADIVKNYESRHSKRTVSSLCEVDIFNLKMWKWNSSITVDQAEYLTSQGYTDLRGTAKLYQKYYPNILTTTYDRNQFLFRHSDAQRTTESFKAFAEGLFGSNNNAQAEPIPENDYLLRPYDYCESWKNHDYSGPDSQDYKFKHSTLWNQTIAAVSQRLGFEYTLESSDVELMFDMCRYEQAWKPDRTSAWCVAFLPEHVYVLEYRQDIHYYYKCGYGYDENSRLNCRAVQDMLTRLNTKNGPNAIAYFAHSTGVQTLLTALGIDKDDVSLLATNYQNMTDRKWRASYIDPFAANFVAVKYECNENVAERENVIFFLNQNAVSLDWCNVGLCSWSEVMKRYKTFYEADCGSYYCRSGAGKVTTATATILATLLAAILYILY